MTCGPESLRRVHRSWLRRLPRPYNGTALDRFIRRGSNETYPRNWTFCRYDRRAAHAVSSGAISPVAAAAPNPPPPANATTRLAGPQHWCGTNGITCAEPALMWSELAGFDQEMQFYPPGWAPWPAGIGCTANQWCAALNIDTFSENENTGQLNNTACLNPVGPEPVNFAFVTKNGVATAPANPQHPEHFVPDPKREFLMRSGDNITVHLFDTPRGLRVVIQDLTTHTRGSMTASAANGFGNVVFDPSATTCQGNPYNFPPEFSTATPQTRNVAAAHPYNVAFSDEIGHFEYCAKVGTDPNSTCLQPLGADTNDGDTAGPDPAGDDDFCLPASASLKVKIGGCLDIDGDFDGVSYNFTWPGSISNPVADRLLNPRSFLFTSPTVHGRNFTSMAFESDISRNESDDTAFRVDTPCQRHVLNPSDPSPGTGCVNPPPNSVFYPFYSTRQVGGTCMWQEGGPYIPGTTNKFGGSAHAEYGPLRVISYPTSPFGAVTKRLNDFRRNLSTMPCPAT